MFIILSNYLNKLIKAWKDFILESPLCFLVLISCMLTVGNIGGAQSTILVCSEISFSLKFTYSDFSGQILELSKLYGEDDVY